MKKCLLSISQVKWYQTINDKARRYNFPQHYSSWRVNFNPIWINSVSLRSKRFRLVSEQKQTVEGDHGSEKLNENQKMKEGGGEGAGKEGRKRLQTNPSILKTCICQRTQRLIGSTSGTILTCVDQRFFSYWEVMYGTWQASSFPAVVVLVGKIYPPRTEHFL